MIVWLIYVASLLYMELVYHFGCFGFKGGSILLPLALIAVLASIQAVVVSFLKGKVQKAVYWFFLVGSCVAFWVQFIYYTVFKQPLQIRAALFGGGDALTSYWKEVLVAIGKASPYLVLLMLPCVVSFLCVKKKKWNVSEMNGLQRIRTCFTMGISALALFMVLCIGRYVDAEYYAEYKEFYAPLSVVEKMGVLTMIQRDMFFEIESLWAEKADSDSWETTEGEFVLTTPPPQITEPPQPVQVAQKEENEKQETAETEPTATPTPPPEIYAYELDLGLLTEACAGEKQKEWLAQYIVNQMPAQSNEYTGIFEGYNLIFLTAEGFSTYAIDPELTPTLYKLANSGFVFNNYYVPLGQTITGDGEYINGTG